MNQMTNNIVAFKSNEPVSERNAFYENSVSGRPGPVTRLIAWIRRQLAARRTIRALDRLDDAMLKDIGFRRIPGEYSKYEPLP